MSIKDDAINLFKKVWNSPNREEAQAVVHKLKPGTYGVGGMLYPAPLLGMLLYDQQRVKALLNKDFASELSSWSERDLKILFGIHNQIRRLNEQCLSPLTAELPEAINGINPYKEYPQIVSTEGFEELLFSEEDAKEVIQNFHKHPAFDLALSTLPLLKQNRHSFEYDQTIPAIVKQIEEAGPGGTPEWFERYEEAKQLKHPNLYVYQHVGAVLSLHSSLATLSQLIFQGIYQAEFLRLTLNHIIDYMWTTAGVGPSMWLMHRPYPIMLIAETTDLIIVNTDRPGQKGGLGDVLCIIQSQPHIPNLSGPNVLRLRMTDKHLNAYKYLLPYAVDK
jgi:hypothetical protein